MDDTKKQPLVSATTNGRQYASLSDSASARFFHTIGGFKSSSRIREHMTLFSAMVDRVTYPWKWAIKKAYLKESLAEFFGTFLLVAIGNGAIAQAVLQEGKFGSFQTINIGYALGLTIAVYVSIGVSGAHLNPAVSFAMALRGRLSWLKVLPFWIAQFLGAFFSSFFVYGIYIDAINVVGKNNLTAGIFATYPAEYLTLGTGFLDQLFGTFILLVGIFAVTDAKNSEVLAGLKPFIIGVILWAIGSSYGMNDGYAVNPARDFGPRIFTAMFGWGRQVFVCDDCNIEQWWWVPIIAPTIGAALAAFFYWFLIEAHHPEVAESKIENVENENELPIN